jgi:hypothetical protein
MSDHDTRLAGRLRQMMNGYQVTQAISVATRLGVPDLLAGGPRSAEDLAEPAGADPAALHRLLRALAALGILAEQGDGLARTFTLTELGALLRRDAPGSLAGWAAFLSRPYHWAAWGDLGHSVRTGEPAFEAQHGEDVWSWRGKDTAESRIFDQAMSAIAGSVSLLLAGAYDFGRFGSLADVGGGDGTLLATVLPRHPGLRGVLVDLPHVVAAAPARLAAAGVADRCEVVAGSFFDEVPAGCDAYLMKSILHDWDDPSAGRILERVRAAAGPVSVLLLVERVIADEDPSAFAGLSDLNMMVMTGGRERTLGEWRALVLPAGFAVTGTVDLGLGWHVIEAAPA